MSKILTPDCPVCGHPPQMIIGPTQYICGNVLCQGFCWNPSETLAHNRENATEIRISFTCPVCNMTSYNKNDVENQYCGSCHTFPENRNDS